MTTDETEEQCTDRLRRFVMDYCDGRIFTSLGLESDELMTCFVVLMLIEERPGDIALVWEYLDRAGPLSINGKPCFFSCHIMKVEDWDRARVAIKAELERRKSVNV